jgi:hypothetical protein
MREDRGSAQRMAAPKLLQQENHCSIADPDSDPHISASFGRIRNFLGADPDPGYKIGISMAFFSVEKYCEKNFSS